MDGFVRDESFHSIFICEKCDQLTELPRLTKCSSPSTRQIVEDEEQTTTHRREEHSERHSSSHFVTKGIRSLLFDCSIVDQFVHSLFTLLNLHRFPSVRPNSLVSKWIKNQIDAIYNIQRNDKETDLLDQIRRHDRTGQIDVHICSLRMRQVKCLGQEAVALQILLSDRQSIELVVHCRRTESSF
jgi:hypothetical protein